MESRRPSTGELEWRSVLSKLLQTAHQRTGVPGIAIAIRSPSQSIAVSSGNAEAQGAERLTPDARFQIGCVAKLLTAIVIAQLVAEGRLDVEAPVHYYLAETARPTLCKAIQLKHLLCHTSGYAGPRILDGQDLADSSVSLDVSWRRFVELFRATPQLFEPGTMFSYENSEHLMLGEIIRRVSGDDILHHYRTRILDVLHLRAGPTRNVNESGFIAEHQYQPSARQWTALEILEHNGFWRASVSDWTLSVAGLCELAQALLLGQNSPLGDTTSRFLTSPVVTLPRLFGGGVEIGRLPQSFGFGCGTFRGGFLGLNGSVRGHSCGLRAAPWCNTTVAVALNASHPMLRDWLLEQVGKRLGSASPVAEQPEECAIQPHALIGRYIGPQDTSVMVRGDGSRLVAEFVRAIEGSTSSIAFDLDQDQRLVRSKDSPPVMMGFFRDKNTDSLGLMLGMTAFIKQSDAGDCRR
jgi:CubicO group peptidase (beta-lactamase class C family)